MKRSHVLKLTLTLVGLIGLMITMRPIPALAATCGVPSLLYSTIKSAVNDSACALIKVAAGTFHEHGIQIERNLTLRGKGANQTFIDGDDAGRVFEIGAKNVTLRGVTIEHGKAARGAGILWENGQLTGTERLTIRHSRFLENAANLGGAIYAAHSVPDAPPVVEQNLNISYTLFEGNTARGGGGALWVYSNVDADHVNFKQNATEGDGGGIYVADGGGSLCLCYVRVNIAEGIFGNNVAKHGGALAAAGGGPNEGHLTVDSSLIAANKANQDGGGIWTAVPTLIVNSTISHNVAAQGKGGGLYARALSFNGDSYSVQYVTFAGNKAGVDAGTVWGDADSPIQIESTILAGGMPNNCPNSTAVILSSQGSNLSSDALCATMLTAVGDLNSTNPMLAPLAQNGGFSKTHALRAGSPAIDGVVNSCPPPATDQRGTNRPQGARCDIGAFEATPSMQ